MKYDAVLFDVDGTLFEYVRPFEQIWQERLAEHGFRASPEDILTAFVAAKEHLIGDDAGDTGDPAEYREMWMRICLRALDDLGFAGDHSRAAESMWRGLVVDKSRPYADVEATLETLHAKGLKLGVVSNYNITLAEALRAHGLEMYFEAIVPSALAGFLKPDGRIFSYALSLLDVAPHRAVFVGDTYENDVVGARSAGMDAVLLSRDRARASSNGITVHALTEILDLL